eukprot:1825351-Amphidinium_carterae.1
MFKVFEDECRFPHAIENKYDKQRALGNDIKAGIEKALCRYGVLQLHEALEAITDWSQHKSVLPDSVHKMAIWVGQK